MEALSTPDTADELARLRRRAYGPDADIHLDPDAVQRLHDLEALSRPADPAPGPSPSSDSASASRAMPPGDSEPGALPWSGMPIVRHVPSRRPGSGGGVADFSG